MEQMTSEMNTDLLIKKYQDKKATISVVGLGYVGIHWYWLFMKRGSIALVMILIKIRSIL